MLPCDAHHHFYHYQSSAQYEWLAVTLTVLGDWEAAEAAYQKSLFQDHFNLSAKHGRATRSVLPPTYDKHPESEAEFCASIGFSVSPNESNALFAAGKEHFRRGEYAQAREAFGEAIRLSHLAHTAYHKHASSEHQAQGEAFLLEGEVELAVAAFSKALDLYQENHAARTARAQLYRQKGNLSMAEQDERVLAK